MTYIKRFLFSLCSSLISFFIYWFVFEPIYTSKNIIITYAVHPFNICEEQPGIWSIIKFSSIILYIFSQFILFFLISQKIFHKKIIKLEENNIEMNNSDLYLKIGFNNSNQLITIPKKSLYQNILITGTIGSGKTSSAMYPFTEQLISYKSNDTNEKLGMLILDVKGNYFSQVELYSKKYKRENDLLVLDLSGNVKYNP